MGGERSLMLLKQIKDEIRLKTNNLMGNYFNNYKLIFEIFKLSFLFITFIYYSICAIGVSFSSVLLIIVFTELIGKYMG